MRLFCQCGSELIYQGDDEAYCDSPGVLVCPDECIHDTKIVASEA